MEKFAQLGFLEKLYLYSCVGPSLILFASPFAFMWNGVHLLISPAASHRSGSLDIFTNLEFPNFFHIFLKFTYSEKATKFCKISTIDLNGTTLDKSTVGILQNFVAFSDYMNFNKYLLWFLF